MSPPRVLVVGGGGMLGHKLVQVFTDQFETWATVRSDKPAYRRAGLVHSKRLLTGVEVTRFDSVVAAVRKSAPDVVVNAVGIVKQLEEARDPVVSIEVNSLFPHRLGRLCQEREARLIHISTDCVFSGRRGMYTEDDLPDPPDLYGLTKLAGEVTTGNALTLRTSIVGRELETRHGLLEWLLSKRGGHVKGFTQAVFSGLPSVVLAGIVAEVITDRPNLSGLYHVASEPIDKYRLLCLMRDAFDAPVEIEPDEDVHVDRSLDGSRFADATGFRPGTWEQLMESMAKDAATHEDRKGT